jgi:hypothetical protein
MVNYPGATYATIVSQSCPLSETKMRAAAGPTGDVTLLSSV